MAILCLFPGLDGTSHLQAANHDVCYADNFVIIEQEYGYDLEIIHPVSDQSSLSKTWSLYLKQEDFDASASSAKIMLPVSRLGVMNTPFLGFVDALNLVDSLVAIERANYVSSPSVRAEIAAGSIVELGPVSSLNIELLLSSDLDVLFVDAFQHPSLQSDKFSKFKTSILTTVAYLEDSVLGRAEWIKVVGLLTGKLDQACDYFERVKSNYLILRSMVAEEATDLPTVLVNVPWGDVWYSPTGMSHTSELINDAAGEYIWKDDRSKGTLPLDLEVVLAEGLDADVWINTSNYRSLEDLGESDSRFRQFRAFKQDRVFSETARVTQSGANDVWELGVVRPDLLLADFVKMFHPELMEDSKFTFYIKLE